MSLLSNFIRTQLLKAVETEFAAHLPEVQALVIKEMEDFANECMQWVKDKLDIKDAPKE